jgi:hypothetical protein
MGRDAIADDCLRQYLNHQVPNLELCHGVLQTEPLSRNCSACRSLPFQGDTLVGSLNSNDGDCGLGPNLRG